MFSKIKLFFLKYFDIFLNLIYNKKCLICGCSKTDELFFKNCSKDVNYLSSFPHRIYKEIPIYSALIYENNIKKCHTSNRFIYHFAYSHIRNLQYYRKRTIQTLLSHASCYYGRSISSELCRILPSPFRMAAQH